MLENNMTVQSFPRRNARIAPPIRAFFWGHVNWMVTAVWLAFAAFSLSLFLGTIPARYLYMRDQVRLESPALEKLGVAPGVLSAFVMTLDILAFSVFILVAILIFWRKSREWMSFFASLVLMTAGTVVARPPDSLFFVDPRLRVPMLVLFALGTGSICILLYIFPDGHLAPRWTFWPALLSAVYSAAVYLVPAVMPQPLRWPPGPISPLVLLAVAGGVAVQVYRYRSCSSRTQRQQTKWIVYGLTVGVTSSLGFALVVPAVWPQVLQPGSENLVYVAIGIPLLYASLILIPVTIGISILFYRLWDIDLLISRTVVYILSTAILAGVYTASIAPCQKLFVALTGQQSDLAVVLATLMIAAAFTPIKNHLQILIDLHWKETQDVAKKLHPLAQQIETRICPVQRSYIVDRLLKEAVEGFDAKGGAVYWEQNRVLKLIQAHGEWDGDAKATAYLSRSDGTARRGIVALGARRNGVDYSERDCQVLQQITSLVAEAIEQDQPQA